jgi:hypothetical protein
MWTAATMMNNQTRDDLISSVHLRAGDNQIGGIFPLSYYTDTGNRIGGEVNPAYGAIYAPMALHLPIKIESGSRKRIEDNGSSGDNVGAIVGCVIGGVVILLFVTLTIFLWYRRQQKKEVEDKKKTMPHRFHVHEYPVIGSLPESERFLSHSPRKSIIQPGLPRQSNWEPNRNIAQASIQPNLPSTEPMSSLESINNGGIYFPNHWINQLRRDVDEMRGLGVVYEPPPQYQTY